jgi:thiosulfate/3-mercaptopyruvate sulfurtransferase
MRAARGLWFLEYFGHPRARLLDGGLKAWQAAGHAVTCDARAPVPSELVVDYQPQVLATCDDVLSAVDRKAAAIVDTRSDDEYMGRNIRAARGGAIPGAIHLEWTRNLDATGRFKSAGDLKALYERAGVGPDREIITYCQGGYRAAHSYLALRLIGYPKVRNYLGSWKEWGDRLDLPIEKPWEKA